MSDLSTEKRDEKVVAYIGKGLKTALETERRNPARSKIPTMSDIIWEILLEWEKKHGTQSQGPGREVRLVSDPGVIEKTRAQNKAAELEQKASKGDESTYEKTHDDKSHRSRGGRKS